MTRPYHRLTIWHTDGRETVSFYLRHQAAVEHAQGLTGVRHYVITTIW